MSLLELLKATWKPSIPPACSLSHCISKGFGEFSQNPMKNGFAITVIELTSKKQPNCYIWFRSYSSSVPLFVTIFSSVIELISISFSVQNYSHINSSNWLKLTVFAGINDGIKVVEANHFAYPIGQRVSPFDRAEAFFLESHFFQSVLINLFIPSHDASHIIKCWLASFLALYRLELARLCNDTSSAMILGHVCCLFIGVRYSIDTIQVWIKLNVDDPFETRHRISQHRKWRQFVKVKETDPLKFKYPTVAPIHLRGFGLAYWIHKGTKQQDKLVNLLVHVAGN